MLLLPAKIRKNLGKKVKILRKKDVLPAVLYGPKIKNLNLEVDAKEFEKVYKEAGESSLVSLKVEGEKQKPSTRAKLGAGLVPYRPAESGTGAGFFGQGILRQKCANINSRKKGYCGSCANPTGKKRG